MNVLLVSAHDDNSSFVAALQYSALSVLERAGHSVAVTNLYAQSFNPVAGKVDFKTSSVQHANYMFEQQRSINTGSGFSPDIESEMDKIKNAELIIFHFPLWWSSVPAIVKGWIDRVFAMGFAWDASHKFAEGLLRGKKVLIAVAAGDPESFYSPDGMHKASVEQHLYPLIHGTFAYCGLDVLKPFVAHNLTAASQEELEQRLADYRDMLSRMETNPEYTYKHADKKPKDSSSDNASHPELSLDDPNVGSDVEIKTTPQA